MFIRSIQNKIDKKLGMNSYKPTGMQQAFKTKKEGVVENKACESEMGQLLHYVWIDKKLGKSSHKVGVIQQPFKLLH